MIPRISLSYAAKRFIRRKSIINGCELKSVSTSHPDILVLSLRWSSHSSSTVRTPKSRYDPTARRPTRRCDPYGQGGEPMAYVDAERLKPTIHIDWIFEMPEVVEPELNNEVPESVPPKPAFEVASLTDFSSSSSESRLISAEEVQRTLADMTHTTKATGASKVFPMLTAGEELQRVLSSISPSTTESSSTVSSSTLSPPRAAMSRPPPKALLRSFVHPDFTSATRFLHTIAAVAQLQAHYPSLTVERKIIHRHWYTVSTIRCHTKVLEGLSSFDFHLAMLIDVEVERPEVQKNILQRSSDDESPALNKTNVEEV